MFSIKKNPIIIIGMHRSGTTLLSKMLETKNDIFWGSKMGKVNNESLFFQSVNKAVLKLANASWDCPEMLDHCNDFYNQQALNYIVNALESYKKVDFWGQKVLIGENFHTVKRKWGWKDPRTTLLIDIWQKVFPQMKAIHIYRNPLDVSLSLQKRQVKYEEKFIGQLNQNKNLPPSGGVSFRVNHLTEGLKLWEYYTKKALNFTGNIIHIPYESLLTEPLDVLERLSNFLEIELPLNFDFKVDASRANAYKNQDIEHEILNTFNDSPIVQKLKYQF